MPDDSELFSRFEQEFQSFTPDDPTQLRQQNPQWNFKSTLAGNGWQVTVEIFLPNGAVLSVDMDSPSARMLAAMFSGQANITDRRNNE